MKALLLCAIALAACAAAEAAVGIVTSTSASVGQVYRASDPGQGCMSEVTNDTMVRTLIGGVHQWQKWVTVPPTGTLRACSTTAGVPDPGWTTRQTSGVTTTPDVPPPPPPPPPDPVPTSPTVTISWTAPTVNVDGTPLTDLAGYILKYGQTDALEQITSLEVTASRHVIPNLAPGVWRFVLIAVNKAGAQSEPAGPVSAKIEAPPPDPTRPAKPSNVTIVIELKAPPTN